MVNKMNLKLIFSTIFLLGISSPAFADLSFSNILHRQYVACGTNSEYPELAQKKDGQIEGFDADICRAFAAAVFGDASRFKMISVKPSAIGSYLNSGKIDVMLGNTLLSPTQEATFNVLPVDTLYFDRQIFASRTKQDASSMRDFSSAKVCILRSSSSSASIKEYNQKHALGLRFLEMPDLASAKEAFYLKRCELIGGSELFIKSIVANLNSKSPAALLPEQVTSLPIKAYSAANTPSLNIAFRAVINALKLAASADITSQNVDTFAATKSPSLQNLLGLDQHAWSALGLNPQWAKDYIKNYGNYHQILERNFGASSPFDLELNHDNPTGNGEFLDYQPFI